MTFQPHDNLAGEGPTFCAVHPTVETSLRCNKCGRYMCTRCAVRTPVGYRCKQCVHQQQDVYFTANSRDYVIAAVVSFVLSVPIAFVADRILGVWLFVFFAGIGAGSLIGEAIHRACGRRRGRYTWLVAAAGIVAGALVVLIYMYARIPPEVFRATRQANFSPLTFIEGDLINLGIYAVLCAGTAIARLRYGK